MDAWQRTVLFWDVLRQRSEQYSAEKTKPAPHVLSFDAELVLDGRTFERPVNDEVGGGINMRPLSASLVILWLAVEVLAPTPTAAQNESPEARELASLTSSSDRFDLFLTQAARVGTFPIKAALEGRLGRQLTEDESRRLSEVFLRTFKDTIHQSEYEAHFAGLFVRYYSAEDLKELVAFYRTSLGLKALRFSSITMMETSAWFHQVTAARQHEFAERFKAEFAREFPALSPELEHKRRQ